MKPSEFKTIIKEAVKEAIQEELKEILLEAVRAPKVIQAGTLPITENVIPAAEKRRAYMDIIKETAGINPGMDTISMNTNNLGAGTFQPTPRDTVSEGSALPPGEVGLDQIIGLMK
jgi:hypothetical protein